MTAYWIGTALILLISIAIGYFEYYLRLHYGPIYVGNARWRRERRLWEAGQAERDAHAALTDADREWLKRMGWEPTA